MGGTQGSKANSTGGAYFRKFILQDFEPWAQHGITQVRHRIMLQKQCSVPGQGMVLPWRTLGRAQQLSAPPNICSREFEP